MPFANDLFFFFNSNTYFIVNKISLQIIRMYDIFGSSFKIYVHFNWCFQQKVIIIIKQKLGNNGLKVYLLNRVILETVTHRIPLYV